MFIGEHGHMTAEFVHYIRFRSILDSSRMSDELCTAEDSESQSIEKFSLTEDSMGGFEGKACLTLQILTQLFMLWDSLSHVEFFFQLIQRSFKFFTHGHFVNFP